MVLRLKWRAFSRAGAGLDWGPIEAAARAVALWRRDGVNSAGLWGLIAAKELAELWPANIPPLPEYIQGEARPRRPWLLQRVARLLGRFGIDLCWRLPHREPPPPMLSVVVDAQVWLGRRNLRMAERWFAPFWYDAPTPLGIASGQGVIWGIACRTLAEDGPSAYLALANSWPLHLTTQPTAADCLSFHLSIEAIVATVARRLGVVADRPARRPGGLRTQAFLTLWPALCLRQDTAARVWTGALKVLVSGSPLTRLVYADLLSDLDARVHFAALFQGFSFKAGAAAIAPFSHESAAPGSAWLDLWMSLVARSLLGAVLSPSRLAEAVRAAERRLEEARRQAMSRYPRRAPVSSDPEVIAAVADLTKLQAEARTAHAERMTSLPAMVGSNPAFRMRFNDMLVRRIAANGAPEMRHLWTPADESDPRDVFFFPPSDSEPRQPLCFWAFEEALFGPNRMTATADQANTWRERLYAFLPEGDPTPDELAELSGLPRRSAQDLATQYRRPVTLPFVGVPGHSAQDLIRHWVQILIGRLPQTTEVTDAEVTVEAATG